MLPPLVSPGLCHQPARVAAIFERTQRLTQMRQTCNIKFVTFGRTTIAIAQSAVTRRNAHRQLVPNETG